MSNPNFTLCLMTCGEETEADCLQAIEPYRGEFAFQEVRNVYPAYKALNQMIEQCQTYLLVPLDADMILYPGFMDRLISAAHAAENATGAPPWHSILFPLWDTLTQEKIYALKVFKTSVVKEIRYLDTPCPDISHYHVLKRNGYAAVDLTGQDPIGDHVVRGGYFCYAKYRDLYNVQRTTKEILPSQYKGGGNLRERAKNHFDFFMKRFVETNDKDYLYCIAGMTHSLTAPLDFTSKDLSNRPEEIDLDESLTRFEEWYKQDRGRIFV